MSARSRRICHESLARHHARPRAPHRRPRSPPEQRPAMPKGKLRLYTSWPMQGAMLPEGTGMKNGVELAVAEAGWVVAGYCLEIVNLDDASPQTGKWDGAVEAENANKAVGDPLAIVYIGTYNSGAAKVSIPITEPRPHGAGHAGQHVPRADQEAGGGAGRARDLPARRVRQLLPRRSPLTTSRARSAPSGPRTSASRRSTSSTTRSSTARASPTSSRPPPRRSASPWSPTRASTGSSPIRSRCSPRSAPRAPISSTWAASSRPAPR